MSRYLRDLIERVIGAFTFGLLAQLPQQGFDVRTWQWGGSLSLAASLALLTLLAGVAARYKGDRSTAGFTDPRK
jgi:hypothetical protein